MIPRVTAIIREAGLVDESNFTTFARERGTAVHLATQYHDEGTLDESTLDRVIMGRLAAYKKFRQEAGPEILAIEESVVNESLGYRGTLDRRLEIHGAEGVLDIKPPNEAPWHALQVQFYADCFDRPMRRWTLHLNDTGGYKLVEHKARTDRTVCRAIMTVHNWRLANEQARGIGVAVG